METLNILVTGGGSPGIAGTLHSLRKHRVVCTDMRENVPGRELADKFYKIPPALDVENYLYEMAWIARRESIDVILPQNTAELDIVQELGTPAACNRNIGKDEISEGKLLENFDDLVEYAVDHEKFVIKPPNSNGSRGVRIVTNEKPDFYRKPGIPVIRWRDLYNEIGEGFRLWAMPFYEGQETTVDCFYGKRGFTAIPRTRDEIRSGISFSGRVVKDQDLIDKSYRLTTKFKLKYAFGFQFIDGKVLECNPRVQGTMVVSTLAGANLIEAACFEALGLDYPKFNINWNLSFTRYWGLMADGVRI